MDYWIVRLAFLGLEAYLWGQAVRPRGGPLRSKSAQSPDSKQAWKLAVALTSGEWRSLLQPENMEKDASEKSIEIKDTLTDASPFLSHVFRRRSPASVASTEQSQLLQ